jgi:teichuronic acid biosynthesis glycosyltransferase TuaH
MISDIDFVILGMNNYDSPYSSTSFSMAKELAKTHRVFFIERPFTYKDFILEFSKKKIQKRKKSFFSKKNRYLYIKDTPEKLTIVNPPLSLPINWLPNTFIYKKFGIFNDFNIFSVIKKIIKDFDVHDFVFYNSFNPFYARKLPAGIKPLLSIYQSVDDISQESYIAKHGIELEYEAVKKADITIATSKQLIKKLSAYTNQIYYLPNGAETSVFKRAIEEILNKPHEFQVFQNKKIIGYIGNICSRLDYNLLISLALENPDKEFVLVGPQAGDECSTSGADKVKNIHFTGSKKMEELPAFLQHMDCTIIPFKCNELTKSIYPLKLNEYLTAGKPVISTNFSEDLRDFKEIIYLANDPDEFNQQLNSAIKENNSDKIKKRIQTAQQNSWEGRVEVLKRLIKEAISSKKALDSITLS